MLHKAPLKHETHRESVYFWRNDKGVWSATERGSGLTALDEFLDNYERIEDALDDQYEKASNARDFFDLLEKIAPIQRAVKNTSKALQNAREVIGEEFIDSRDKAEELYRNIDLLYTDSKNGLDYAIAKRAEEQAEMQKQALTAGHRLNIIMALFLPITAVASLLGMNIPHGLEKSQSWVFFAIVGVCSLLGIFMRSLVLKKSKAVTDE